MPPEDEFVKKPTPVVRAYRAIKAAVIWVRTRKSTQAVQNAIASNAAATTALAASVAAAGIGGYATYEAQVAEGRANQAIQQQASIEARLNTVEASVDQQAVALANFKAEVATIADASDVRMRAMGLRAQSQAQQMAILADQVAGLPSAPDIAPLAARVSRLATETRDTARKAEEAAQKAAQEHTDEEARAAASAAATDARLAAEKADEARKVADQAQADADAANGKIDNAPTPTPEPPFRRTLTMKDLTTSFQSPSVSYGSVGVDLDQGRYKVTFTAQVETAPNIGWFVNWNPTTVPVPRTDGVGPASLLREVEFNWGGGVLTMGGSLDATTGGNPGQTLTLKNITMLIEETQ